MANYIKQELAYYMIVGWNWRKRWEFELMLKWHCSCHSEIGTRFWSNLAKRRFILMFWRYISTFNVKQTNRHYLFYSLVIFDTEVVMYNISSVKESHRPQIYKYKIVNKAIVRHYNEITVNFKPITIIYHLLSSVRKVTQCFLTRLWYFPKRFLIVNTRQFSYLLKRNSYGVFTIWSHTKMAKKHKNYVSEAIK